MTQLYLITGFLGAGKTSFLKERLMQSKEKVGVLMNEFGKISIDTLTIQHDDLSLMELTNGSIFCSCLKDNFIQGLIKMLSLGLDELYIEASGLSDPSDMGKVLSVVNKSVDPNSYCFRGTICLIDALFFKKELKVMVSVERQVKHSHHLLVNKVDLITEAELAELEAILQSMNQNATITPIQFGKVDWEVLKLDQALIADEPTTNTIESRPRSLVMNFNVQPQKEVLLQFLNQISSFFFRIKGYMEIDDTLYKIDGVSERIELISMDKDAKFDESHCMNELVFLSSRGLESISALAKAADQHIPGLYKLNM